MESLHRSPRATGTSRDGAAASSASPSCSRRCARRIRAAREAPRGAGRPGRLAARSENGHLETGRRAIVAPMETIWGLDAEALNRARISRDARFDGKFYIAVTSTGIYCRPICPSRYAKRSNVRFFGSPAAAEAAGFRPCLRCRPEAAPGTPAWLGTAAVVRRALRLINEGALDEDSVEALAGRLGLAYRPPYDWSHLRDFLAARAISGVERVDARGYARTVAFEGGHALICVRALTGEDALELRVRGAPPAALLQLASVARRVFDLAADPARIGVELATDPLVGPLVRKRPGLRIAGAWDAFECAVRAVLGQQVSVAAGCTFAARVVERAGVAIRGGADGLTHLFPTAASLAGANLDHLGITRTRAATLHALARAVLERRLDFSAAPEALAAALTALPGIGPWTAQYVALRALGEPDALPTGDLVLRRMAAPRHRMLSARELEERARDWRPWRGYAVMHLWSAAGNRGARIDNRRNQPARVRARA